MSKFTIYKLILTVIRFFYYFQYRSMWIHAAVSSSIVLLCCLTGLIIYAKYFDCDPVTAKVHIYNYYYIISVFLNFFYVQIIEKPDQIVPLYVMETVGRFPGLTGLYIAGVFSGSLRYVYSSRLPVRFQDLTVRCFQALFQVD